MRQGVQSGADDHLHAVLDARARQVPPCHLGVGGFVLQRDDATGGPDGAGEVDGAVAGQRADLQDAGRARRRGEQIQQLAVLRGHLDGGHPRGFGRLPRGRQRIVLGAQQSVEELIKRLRVRLSSRGTRYRTPSFAYTTRSTCATSGPMTTPASSQKVATNSGPWGGSAVQRWWAIS